MSANEWLWHLFNDPMNENPWSFGLMILFGVAIFGRVALLYWRHRPPRK